MPAPAQVWEGTTTLQPATTAAPELYDCSGDDAEWVQWEVDKRTWCCSHHGKACGTFTTTAPPMYDCSFGYPDWVPMWSSEKKVFCCGSQKRGCPQLVAGSASAVAGASVEPFVAPVPGLEDEAATSAAAAAAVVAQDSQMLQYDCFSFLRDGWTAAHSQWCCKYEKVACPEGASPASSASQDMVYDCEWGFESWQQVWSAGQAIWCCQHAGRGCQNSAASPTALPQLDIGPAAEIMVHDSSSAALGSAEANVASQSDGGWTPLIQRFARLDESFRGSKQPLSAPLRDASTLVVGLAALVGVAALVMGATGATRRWSVWRQPRQSSLMLLRSFEDEGDAMVAESRG
mmetsp:Transcript_40657/g.103457  ORF Transcript_40657/g.103457 Transcript_40657/m.103457 type:complete len:346 (+) Transcript_40657:2-1039(+)